MLPDVNRMTQAQLDDLLERSEFATWQKDELLTEQDKTLYYADTMTRRNLIAAHNKFMEFDAYLTKSGIFIPKSLKAQFEALNLLMHEAVMERRLQDSNKPPSFDKGVELHSKAPALLKALEHDVQTRLWTMAPTSQ